MHLRFVFKLSPQPRHKHTHPISAQLIDIHTQLHILAHPPIPPAHHLLVKQTEMLLVDLATITTQSSTASKKGTSFGDIFRQSLLRILSFLSLRSDAPRES